jgi:two-component system response regulator AtoC
MNDKPRILVVEDDDELRKSLVAQLSNEGYDVREASSGNTAIPIAYGTALNLILLDLNMPYINGIEFLKFMRGTFPGTKIIVLTAYAEPETITDCKNLGAEEVILKPYDIENMLSTIQKMLK